MKFFHDSSSVCRMGSWTAPSCFSSNFTDGCSTFAKFGKYPNPLKCPDYCKGIFFCRFIEFLDFMETADIVVFGVAEFESAIKIRVEVFLVPLDQFLDEIIT